VCREVSEPLWCPSMRLGYRLGPGDFVQVECACGHTERLTALMLTTAGVGRTKRFRGWEAECAVASVMRKEAAVISIRWAAELGRAATKKSRPCAV
jgi:hypothetical protein